MPSIANLAAQTLQRRIVRGDFPAGATLPSQRELSEQLSISRSSLREAISTLEALGLVRTQPGKGVFVVAGGERQATPPKGTASMSPQALLEFRLALEPAWTRLAALRSDASGHDRLEAIQRGMETTLEACDLVMAADWDLQFHLCLAELSGNPGLLATARQFSDQIGHSLRLPFSNPASVWEPVDEHQAIITAVLAGDAPAAEQAMHAHLIAAAQRVGLDVHESEPPRQGA
jgi:GntR family transcriptional repressor for pyruvate dehydrogenase complex